MMGTGAAITAARIDQLRIAGVTVTNNGTKTTFVGTSGDYWQFGTIGTNTSHSLNSENDVFIVGELEVDGNTFHDGKIIMGDNTAFSLGAAEDTTEQYETSDADALDRRLILPRIDLNGNNVPVYTIGDLSVFGMDLGLFDGVAQPTIAMIEKDAKYFSSSAVTSDDGGATNEMLATGIGTNAAIGDIIRVTAGTNAVVGFYVVDVVDSANEVTLSTNWTTGDVSSGVVVSYHDFTMLSADGICTRDTDGHASASSGEIDRDGWLNIDNVRETGQLYARMQSNWWRDTADGDSPDFAAYTVGGN